MESIIFVIVFFLLLIDSIGANLISWGGGERWWHRHFRILSRYFPLTRGWTTLYLVLVIFIGAILCKFGALSF